MKAQIFTRNFINTIPGFDTANKPIGGAEIYIENLALLLSKMSFQIEIFQFGNAYSINNYKGFRVITLSLGAMRSKLFPVYLPRVFYNLEEKHSLKIYNYPNYAIAREATSPAIGIFHGVEWDTSFFGYISREIKYRKRGFKGLVLAIAKYLYFTKITPFFVYKGVDKLDITVSVDSKIKDYLPKRLSNKVRIIYNFVDCSLFKMEKAKEEDYAHKKVKILVPRNLNIARGVFILPEVCKMLIRRYKNVEFIVTGSGPLKSYLDRKIWEYKLGSYIKIIGHVSHDVMPRYYADSDIVLITSVFSEGTTLAVLEAMACAKPVITTNVGGIEEIGLDGIHKIVTKFDVNEIVSKILFLINNRDFAYKLGIRARSYVCNNFCKENWDKKWVNIIEELMN